MGDGAATTLREGRRQELPPACSAGCDPEVFKVARRAYDSPGRHYHTWSHALACLGEFRRLTFDRPQAVCLALLFHDAVYVPGRPDNEEKSAALAEQVLGRHSRLDPGTIADAGRMIRLTAHAGAPASLTADEAAVLDIDLSILGAPWPDYRAYGEAVRKEFCPAVMSPEVYRTVRLSFLRGILHRKSIFHTDAFRTRLEAQARANIGREIESLRAEECR